MILQGKSLEKLRLLINEETEYRSGPNLVNFFNDLGFNDSYGQGFPSRWVYTDEKLTQINGKPELDKCIKKLFAPVNFIGRFTELDNFIKEFNQFLAFDKWKVIRNEAEITFAKADKINFDDNSGSIKEDEFLKREFSEISLEKIGLDATVTETLKLRFEEIKKCLTVEAPLSVLFLAGSALEGILLGIALKHPKEFNQSKSSPKDKEGKITQFQDWTLSNYIDVAYDLGLLMEDVRKFSHLLRDFRNYIHPYAQVSSGFNPDKHTATICWQVLKAAIYQLTENKI
ncbi:MAG: hypothetical protein U9N54_10170 [candidate division Zixibacteria bacterium]|nr:hypothetical protein [candidate division Zixibacteria bacterium]